MYLYHRNTYAENLPYEDAVCGGYHRQKDVHPTKSLQKIVEYISAHDRAKTIIATDYKKLPKATSKQRHYYRVAENKAKIKQAKRLDDLFAQLEKQK